MHRTDPKERIGKLNFIKGVSQTMYNTMSITKPVDSAREAFLRPPFGSKYNEVLNKGGEKK